MGDAGRVRHGHAARNPVGEVERPAINRDEGTTLAFSKVQARKLLDAPPEDTIAGSRDRAMLSVGLQVGLRRAEIAARTTPAERIAIADHNAGRLAANTVCVGDTLVMPGCGDDLRETLEARGYRIIVVPLPEFLRSGGAAFCLTLRLDRRSAAAAATRAAVA